jgi:hypothetical protein
LTQLTAGAQYSGVFARERRRWIGCTAGSPPSQGWEAALAEAGYVEGGDAASGAYAGPVDPGTGLPTIAVVTGDGITFLSTAAFAGLLAPHAI